MIVIKTSKNAVDEFVFETDGQPCFMGNDPTFGYEQEYIQKVMLSGKVKRIYRGKRFTARVNFGYLPDAMDSAAHVYKAGGLYHLLDEQRRLGCLYARISSPESDSYFAGDVFLNLDESQRRFKYDKETRKYVWVGYALTITACEVVE